MYKIADKSHMMTVKEHNPLLFANEENSDASSRYSGKLDDVVIRELCTEQFVVRQKGANIG